ncbi:hypothetical protein F4780DRAFT_16513 [Xylariomycetidae sp. FL0641]|nr:hypothetical protein F4780DRAFT_16513 [Xylariomycetidae sp. FL0641]
MEIIESGGTETRSSSRQEAESWRTASSASPASASPQPHSQSPRRSRRVSFNLSPPRDSESSAAEQPITYERRSISAPVPEPARPETLKRVARMGSMTSFPRLLSRSCTDDWVTPLGLFGEHAQAKQKAIESDLYGRGVDAHCGICLHSPLPTPLSTVEESPQPVPQLEPQPGVYSPATGVRAVDSSPEPDRRWSCQPGERRDRPDPQAKRFGRSLGASTHHRRKSSMLPAELQPNEDPNEGLLSKLRRYSFMPLLDHTPESIRSPSPPVHRKWSELPVIEEPVGTAAREHRSSTVMLREILDRSSNQPSKQPSTRSSCSSSKSRPTKGKEVARLPRPEGPCMEDTSPHVCVDEQMTPGSDRQIFWAK